MFWAMFRKLLFNLQNGLASLQRLNGVTSNNKPTNHQAKPLLSAPTQTLASRAQQYVNPARTTSSYLDCFMTQNCNDLLVECTPKIYHRRQPSGHRRTKQKSATIRTNEPFKLHALNWGPEEVTSLTRKESVDYYTQMQMIRHIEMIASDLFRQRYALPRATLRIGHEASAVGIRAAMRKNDKVVMAHRCLGWAHLMGVSPFQIFSELAGHRSGPAHGKGGSLHMYAHNFYGSGGSAGSQVPIGAGIALASKYVADGSACLTIYDGSACQQGRMVDTFNIAARWSLPCVFVCHSKEDSAGLHTKATHYRHSEKIPGIAVDGTDVLAVRSATDFAIDYVLEHGPIIVELVGSMSTCKTDQSTCRTIKNEMVHPISKFGSLCMENHLFSQHHMECIDAKVFEKVNNAAVQALLEKEVDSKDLTADIYAKCLESNIRGVNWFSLTDTWMANSPMCAN